jgi:hypothetical protein
MTDVSAEATAAARLFVSLVEPDHNLKMKL